jgi:beta-mannosidase
VKTFELNGKWKGLGISPEGKKLEFTGTVPGCVHTDLWAEGMIKEPYYRFNGDECQWIENWDWEYEREFTIDEVPTDSFIEFEGLDTFCDVYLNGEKVGTGDDMFLDYRFSANGKLKKGKNTLKVKFYSCIRMVEGKPYWGYAFTGERINIRRIQCTFGWDWVQRFVTCGILKPVRLCVPEKAQIESVYVYTRAIDDFGAQVGIDLAYDVRGTGAYADMSILAPDGSELFKKNRLIVEGVNMIKRHTRPNPAKQVKGGIVEREASLNASNVQLVCPECGAMTRIGRRTLEDGRKVRFCRKCEGVIDK